MDCNKSFYVVSIKVFYKSGIKISRSMTNHKEYIDRNEYIDMIEIRDYQCYE